MKVLKALAIILIGFMCSCASSSNTSSSNAAPDNDVSLEPGQFIDLADYLVRVPGLTVNQRGGKTTVMVRGISSISGSSEPLFVVDRTQVGGYDNAAAIVDPNDIDRVEVLKDVASTNAYGMLGANGVIIIHTKKY